MLTSTTKEKYRGVMKAYKWRRTWSGRLEKALAKVTAPLVFEVGKGVLNYPSIVMAVKTCMEVHNIVTNSRVEPDAHRLHFFFLFSYPLGGKTG